MTTCTQARESMFIMVLSPKKEIGPLGKAKPWEHWERIQQLQSTQPCWKEDAAWYREQSKDWMWHHLPAI